MAACDRETRTCITITAVSFAFLFFAISRFVFNHHERRNNDIIIKQRKRMENMKHNYLPSRQHRRVFDIIFLPNLLKVSCFAVLMVHKKKGEPSVHCACSSLADERMDGKRKNHSNYVCETTPKRNSICGRILVVKSTKCKLLYLVDM